MLSRPRKTASAKLVYYCCFFPVSEAASRVLLRFVRCCAIIGEPPNAEKSYTTAVVHVERQMTANSVV